MSTKFRTTYHKSSQRAHHHTLIVGLGLFLCASMTLTQLFPSSEQTHASGLETRCMDHPQKSITDPDCEVLVDLYESTDGDNWYNNNGWFQGDGSNICGGRQGIGCTYDSDGMGKYYIQNIWLGSNNLVGVVPDSIYTLPYLEKLRLDGNELDVDIDKITQSAYATSYKEIGVNNNNIHGNITNFGNLTNLEYLDISCYSEYASANPENCTAVGDISFVPSLTKLYALKVGGHVNVTFDLSYLEQSPQLRKINALDNYVIGNVSSLTGATGMELLDIACWNLLDGTCDVVGNLDFTQNMMNLEYLSLDGLLNIEGTLDVLYDKTMLTQIDLSHNKITGTIGAGIGNLTMLDALDLDDNELSGPLPIELESLTRLTRLNLNSNPDLIGSLINFNALPVLETLNIGATSMDYSNVRDTIIPETPLCSAASQGDPCVPKPSRLKYLSIDNANIGGELPDIWSMFPDLEELNLQFNALTGPFPASFALLTNLNELQIRYNNMDGTIPVYLTTFNLAGGRLALEANCFDIDVSDEDLLNLLTNNSPGRNNQLNCRANIQVNATTDTDGLGIGQCAPYVIHYNNLGPQKAINVKIGQTFGENITASSSTPSYTEGLVGRTYGTLDDPCYVQATQSASGPYFDRYEDLLLNNQQYPFASVYDLAIAIGGFLGGEQFTGEQGTTEFAYVLDRFCPFVFGTSDPYICLSLFGMDLSEVDDPSCGYGGEQGYLRNLGDLPTGTTGTIQVELCNNSDSIEILSCEDINVQTISANENELQCNVTVGGICGDAILDTGEQCDAGIANGQAPNIVQGFYGSVTYCTQSCTIETIQGGYCGDGQKNGEEQCDDGNTTSGDGCSATCTTQTSGGGNGGGGGSITLKTDTEEGICKVGEDTSASSYDRKCTDDEHKSADKKKRLIDDPEAFNKEVKRVAGSMTCAMSEELVRAYVFAFDIGATTVEDICQAGMLEPFDRQVASKIMSNFAMNVLDKQPENRVWSFVDTKTISDEMQGFTKLALDLHLMGENRDGTPHETFDPTGAVTREMFGVITSRLLYGEANNTAMNDQRGRSTLHLKALQKDGIMKNIDKPFEPEIKGYALTALMRAYLLQTQ